MLSFKNWLRPYCDVRFCENSFEQTGKLVYKGLFSVAQNVVSDSNFPITWKEQEIQKYIRFRDDYELLRNDIEDAYVEYVYVHLYHCDLNKYRKVLTDWIFEDKSSDDDLYYEHGGSTLLYGESLVRHNQELVDLGVRTRIWLDEDELWRIVWDILYEDDSVNVENIRTLADLYGTKHGELIRKLLFMCKTHKQRRIEYVRSRVTPKIRMQVLERDHFACQLCGRTASDGVKLEVDHKIPVSRGGTSDLSNLWTLCFDCNRGKSSSILDL